LLNSRIKNRPCGSPSSKGRRVSSKILLDRIDTQRRHVERQLQRLLDAYQQEIITLHGLSTRREQITQRLKGFEQERHHVEQQRDTTIKWDRIADNIRQFRTLLGSHLDRLTRCSSFLFLTYCLAVG
jgi:hypothetical protein